MLGGGSNQYNILSDRNIFLCPRVSCWVVVLLWWCLSVVDGRMVGSGFIFIIIVKSRGITFWKEFSPPPLCSPMIMFRAVGRYENLE